MEQVAGTEARTDPLDRRAIGHFLAHEGQCEGFDSPTHNAAQQRAQVRAHNAQHTTGCGSVTVRAGTGYSTAISAPPAPSRGDDVVRLARNRDEGVTLDRIAADFGIHPVTSTMRIRQADVGDDMKPGASTTCLPRR